MRRILVARCFFAPLFHTSSSVIGSSYVTSASISLFLKNLTRGSCDLSSDVTSVTIHVLSGVVPSS